MSFETTRDLPLTPIGAHVRDASLDTALTLTAPQNARRLWFTVETQAVRLVADGTAATATKGLLINAGETYVIDVKEKATLSFFEATSGAVLNYQWSA